MGATPASLEPNPALTACPYRMITAQHKSGVLYLLRADAVRTLVAKYQFASFSGDTFITQSIYSPAHNLLFVTSPTAGPSTQTGANGTVIPGVLRGISAFRLLDNCTLALAWSNGVGLTSSGPYSTPTVAGDVVYFTSGSNKGLHALNALTGALLSTVTLSNTAYFSPIVAGGKVLVGDFSFTTTSAAGNVYMYGV